MAGFGLDWTNENAKLSFDTYCRIQSFLEYQTMSDAELVKMWVKILNPSSLPVIEVSEMQDFFERFTRGKSLQEPSLISDTFAKQMMILFQLEDCLVDDNQRVQMEKLREKIEDGTISPQIFSQMLSVDCNYIVESRNHTVS